MEVTVIRSANRRKTAEARVVDGRLEVRIPSRSTKAEESRLVEQFRARFERSSSSAGIDLATRARRLAKHHDLPRPAEIRWVSNQAHRWGSCTPSTGVIRISDRLAGCPPWVLDHVIVHELAHLVEPGHNARFADLAARYPLAERAEGYLLALTDGTDPTIDPLANDLDAHHEPAATASASAGERDRPSRDPVERAQPARQLAHRPMHRPRTPADRVPGRPRVRRPTQQPALPFPD